jgi:lipoic acid synthetase
MSVEVLIPDFEGDWAALQMVIDARPHIINHNLETVRRMYPAVRPSAKFDRSLELLRRVKEAGMVAKTGIMVGIGERDDEVMGLMREVQGATRVGRDEETKRRRDGVDANDPDGGTSTTSSLRLSVSFPTSSCDILTIGQYLQPTRNHLPIDRWVTPEQFAAFKAAGLEAGFKVVESGPLVRSSYHADHQADVLSTIGAERGRRSGA